MMFHVEHYLQCHPMFHVEHCASTQIEFEFACTFC